MADFVQVLGLCLPKDSDQPRITLWHGRGYKAEDQPPGDDDLSLNCSELKLLLLSNRVAKWEPLQSGRWQSFTILAPADFPV